MTRRASALITVKYDWTTISGLIWRGRGPGGLGSCEPRIEAIVKIIKKKSSRVSKFLDSVMTVAVSLSPMSIL